MNAECDLLLMRLEKRLGVTSGESSARALNIDDKNDNPRAKTKAPSPTGIQVTERGIAPTTPLMSSKTLSAPKAILNKFNKAPDIDHYTGDYSIGVELPSFSLASGHPRNITKRNLLDQPTSKS